ncbi:MAG TPA: CaiB/BaiF CoA-transferase family protein [Casimicrobiaceae bacterium]|nr:CaiB/BaiF CoA-transferase family protein [Casimicrobiaceae bacterium]
MHATATGPLADVRVVELAAIGPVPFAAMLCADMGADVVRIGRPGAPVLRPHDIVERGRRVVELDLKTDEGVASALALIEHADVLIEGFRPGVMERLGLGPDVALARNPRIVYGRMTGWGQSGPLAQAAGHDIDYIALAGALAAIGERDRAPVPPLNLLGDFGGGALYLVVGVLAALLEARGSGHGQVIDCAMVDGAASLMTFIYAALARGEWRDARGSNLLDGGAPFYGTYRCADGRYIAVGALEAQFHAELIERLGLDAEAFGDRDDPASWPRLRRLLEESFLRRTRREWCELLEGSDACFAPVLDMREAAQHPHLAARATIAALDGVPCPAPAPRFSRTPGALRPVAAQVHHAAVIAQEWAGHDLRQRETQADGSG